MFSEAWITETSATKSGCETRCKHSKIASVNLNSRTRGCNKATWGVWGCLGLRMLCLDKMIKMGKGEASFLRAARLSASTRGAG